MSVKRGEEAVNLQGLYSTEGRVDEVDKEKAEEEVEEEAEEDVKEEALLPCQDIKYNILCIVYVIKRFVLILGNRFTHVVEILGKMLIYYG